MSYQRSYWNSVAYLKTFTHPVSFDTFSSYVSHTSRILDCGCGYGRTCAELVHNGYSHVVGVDTSSEMIKRGLTEYPHLNLITLTEKTLPFDDNSFDACVLLAVLTCIPNNEAQTNLMDEITRVLKPQGLLYLSDYPLQKDNRNINRYDRFKNEFSLYGVFRLPDGGIVRHHDMAWIDTLLRPFKWLSCETITVSTMNGNTSTAFQIYARKR